MPDRLDIRLKLAEQHLYLGETEAAFDLLEASLPETQNDPDWLAVFGKTLRALGRNELAQEYLLRAWKRGVTEAGLDLAKLLGGRDQCDDAISICYSLLDRDSTNFAAAQMLCRNLIASGQWEKLEQWTSACLQNGQWNAVLPSALAYTARGDEHNGLIRELVEVDQYPVCIQNFTGSATHDKLCETLLNHKARSNFPTIYAGKGSGQRIDRISDIGIDPVTEIFERIKIEVGNFGQLLADNVAPPAVSNIPENATIESWGNICVDDGHEDWHCHPAGWLSGVYYLDVPELSDKPDLAGQIEFGPLMLDTDNTLDTWPKKRIRPEADMLLLFPSYFGHRTYPTGSNYPRISIAFDIVPNSNG
ncbi:MAG: putative 2OG-Fe(II) oxygenase [Parasphingorhabdus sp.]